MCAHQNKVLMWQQERFDLPDFNYLQDYVSDDFKSQQKSLFTQANTYIVNGFNVLAAGGSSVSVNLQNCAVLYGGYDGSLYSGPSAATVETFTLSANATTCIWATVAMTDVTPTQVRTFWDPLGGVPPGTGEEFQSAVIVKQALEVTISHQVLVNFPTGTDIIPIAKVTTNLGGAITAYQDCRNLLFRLGSGGNAPDIDNTTDWSGETRIDYTNATDANPTLLFAEGDRKNTCFKDWMNMVMSQIKEMKFGSATGGLSAWYSPAPSSLSDADIDMTGGGVWSWNLAAGELSFTADANLLIPGTPYVNVIRFDTQSPIFLPAAYPIDGEFVAWVTINRGASSNLAVHVDTQDDYVPGPDKIIIARRIGNTVYVGVH